MGFDPKRIRQIVKAQRANYPYLNDQTADKLIGTILANRRKDKVHITADFMPALLRCGISLEQQRGYVQVAADYFNQKGSIIKHGASFGIYNAEKRRAELKKGGMKYSRLFLSTLQNSDFIVKCGLYFVRRG